MQLPEELLHFIWQFGLYDQLDLKTVEGQPVKIIDQGAYNRNAGPDFEFAKVQMRGFVWSGHIEIHVNSKDWVAHGHHLDKRYNSVVLHVVWDNMGDVYREDGTLLPVLCLKDYVDELMMDRYVGFKANRNWIPCEKQINNVKSATFSLWLERMAMERLEEKFVRIESWLQESNFHWEQVMLRLLGHAFGTNLNAIAFGTVLEYLGLSLLSKYRGDKLKVEALLFGVAGLLPILPKDKYVSQLKNEFDYLQRIHDLTELSILEWKFHRTRPYNFPTVRMGQLAAFLLYEMQWFEKICQEDDVEQIVQEIRKIEPHLYWKNHFRFDISTTIHSAKFTESFVQKLIINCFAPILFAYGKYIDHEVYTEKAVRWLTKIAKEENSITKRFEQFGIQNENAAISQGILHLKKAYCEQKRCLECAVGLEILKA